MEFLRSGHNHLFNGTLPKAVEQEEQEPITFQDSVEHYIYSVDPGIAHSAHVVVKLVVTEHDAIPSIESIQDINILRPNETVKELMKKKGSQMMTTLTKRLEHVSKNYIDFFYKHQNGFAHVVIEDNCNNYTKDIPAIMNSLPLLTVEEKHLKPIHVLKPKAVWASMKRDCGWQKGDKVTRSMKKKMTRAYIKKIFRLGDDNELSTDVNDALLNALCFAKKNNYFSDRPRRYMKRRK